MKKSVLTSLILAALASFLFTHCDKDDPEPLPCLLSAQMTAASGFTYTYNLYFDNRQANTGFSTMQTPNSALTSTTITYTYNSAGDLSEINYSSGIREVYTYTQGKITKKETFSSSILIEQIDYEYANDQLIKTQYYGQGFGTTSLQKAYHRTFEYATPSDKSPMRARRFEVSSGTTPSITVEYTYSDKKSAFAAAPAGLLQYFYVGGQSIDKALTKQVTYLSTSTETVSYDYEFNAAGYPTKRTETYAATLPPYITTYTYSCD